jgi:hypothetical protein
MAEKRQTRKMAKKTKRYDWTVQYRKTMHDSTQYSTGRPYTIVRTCSGRESTRPRPVAKQWQVRTRENPAGYPTRSRSRPNTGTRSAPSRHRIQRIYIHIVHVVDRWIGVRFEVWEMTDSSQGMHLPLIATVVALVLTRKVLCAIKHTHTRSYSPRGRRSAKRRR